MRALYTSDGRPVRRGVGFTCDPWVIREDGDETTATGVGPPKDVSPWQTRDMGDKEREEPRCQR